MKELNEIKKITDKFIKQSDIFIKSQKDLTTRRCAWCGDVLGVDAIYTAGNECFCCDMCKSDYKQEHCIAE